MDRRFVISTILALQVALPLSSDVVSQEKEIYKEKIATQTSLEAFTGQVKKNRVRMRLQPTLDSVIIKELSRDDLVVVTGENSEFYEVLPPVNMKGYIFRTYVLDGQIEGSHVNVRLDPDTASQVVCQVNSGEKISGDVSSKNSKWLEIALPESVRFFIAKDYVNKVGNASAYHSLIAARKEFESELQSIELKMKEELEKPFNQLQFASLATDLQQLIAKNQTAGEKSLDEAKALLCKMQEACLDKCINEGDSVVAFEEKVAPVVEVSSLKTEENVVANVPFYSANWAELERRVIQSAIERNVAVNEEEFLMKDQKSAVALSGVLKPYTRHVKNVPGDYILVDPKSNVPVAFLYSIKVDLRPFIGKEVGVKASERPNNNFAYPAYSVWKVE